MNAVTLEDLVVRLRRTANPKGTATSQQLAVSLRARVAEALERADGSSPLPDAYVAALLARARAVARSERAYAPRLIPHHDLWLAADLLEYGVHAVRAAALPAESAADAPRTFVIAGV
jgi:hypothetical protein